MLFIPGHYLFICLSSSFFVLFHMIDALNNTENTKIASLLLHKCITSNLFLCVFFNISGPLNGATLLYHTWTLL